MKKLTFLLSLLACLGFISKEASAQKKPILYVPLGQSELAYNLVKECSTIELTWIIEKADLVVSWGMNEKESRNDWVVYAADGHVIGSGETIRVSATARDICKAINGK
jgi:hypothetical protein